MVGSDVLIGSPERPDMAWAAFSADMGDIVVLCIEQIRLGLGMSSSGFRIQVHEDGRLGLEEGSQ